MREMWWNLQLGFSTQTVLGKLCNFPETSSVSGVNIIASSTVQAKLWIEA